MGTLNRNLTLNLNLKYGEQTVDPTFNTSRTPNFYFSVAPNPLFHSVCHFAFYGRTSLYYMKFAGQPIEWKINVDF